MNLLDWGNNFVIAIRQRRVIIGLVLAAIAIALVLPMLREPPGEKLPPAAKFCEWAEYDMVLPRSEENAGAPVLLGNLTLSAGRYRFTAHSQSANERRDSFFQRNPTGNVKIEYAENINRSTWLKSLADGTRLATLIFSPDNHSAPASFVVINLAKAKLLHLEHVGAPMPFQLRASWGRKDPDT